MWIQYDGFPWMALQGLATSNLFLCSSGKAWEAWHSADAAEKTERDKVKNSLDPE
jgi:hypothetical protein